MERRRFNLSSMSPMADSTRIDASLIGNRHSPASFLRGLSPKGASNNTLNGSRTPERSSMNHTATSPSSISRQKLNLSQLDPRTFADVHSSGLASRIVGYHESSLGGRSSLQRSMSASNLYNPLMQPRRAPASPLPYKSKVPALSMTQIAPPERSFYSGNTLPSLLRSNSLAGVVHKASEQEQLSRENRPILHPPHPQHESEPTRSVLEELKEISRKRINSGDAPSPHDFTKRSCQRGVDFVDHQRHQQQLHQLQQQQNQSFKRQRELTVSVPLRHHSTSLGPAPPTMQHMHSNGSISPTQSPEQLAKRPNCSYNNDIASSLSSSRRHNNKRKLFDMRESFQRSQSESMASGSSPDNSPGENVAKIQRKVNAESISKTLSMPVPAVSAVPPTRTISAPPAQRTDQRSAEVSPASEKPKLTLFNARQSRTKMEQPRQDLNSPEVDAGEYAGIQFVKPKQQNSMLGVKNPSVERTHKTKLAIMLSGLKGELYQGEPDELDAPAPAPAALPTPIKPTIVPPVTTTTTSATSTATTTTSAPSKPVILGNQVIKPAETSTTSITSPLPKLMFGQAATPASTEAVAPKTTDKDPAAPAAIPAKTDLPANPVTPATSSQLLINFGTPKSSTAPPLSFGNANATVTTTISTSATETKPMFSFGKTSGNQPLVGVSPRLKTGSPEATESTTTNSGMPVTTTTTFGTAAPTPTATAASTTSTSSPISFGKPISAGSTGSTTTKNPTTATISPFGAGSSATSSAMNSLVNKPIFTFGQSGDTSSQTSISSENGAASTKTAVFSFGGSTTQPTGAALTHPFASQSQTGGNSFGGIFSQPAATKPEPSKPGIFGNQDNSLGSAFRPPGDAPTTTAAEPSKPFGFGASTTVASGAPAATNLFAFGGAPTLKTTEPTTTSTANNLFGQNAATTTPFAFGGGAAAEGNSKSKDNKSIFAFGGGGDNNSATKPSSMFNFGGADKGAPPAFGSVATSVSSAAPTPTSNAFGFNTAQKPATPMFGSGSAQQAPAPAVAATKPFTFGGAQQAPGPSASPASGGFSFAAVASKNTAEQSGTNMFGSPVSTTKPSFNFGGNTGNQAGSASPGGFSFGTPRKKEEPAATNMFGNPNTGVVKPTFSFSNNNSSTQSAAPAPAPSFGGFGSPAAPPANGPNQNKPFAFGGSTAAPAPSPAPMGGNLFANAVAATQNQSKPGVFPFGGAKSTASATAGNAPFSFSGAAAGGIASPPSNHGMNTAKPFSFGGAGGNPAPNVFASQAPAPAASNPAGAFSFGGGSPAQQANAGNVFAPPPSTPESRPIRKATRRLQK
ncbi:nuclear pore complex protein DDB_G0274915 [Drosophila rhopaloa]|uniref:Nuclear pore complex protein DDB_G0274915 n=1 Tax=Drosophila rhopaloa TaxID=1041015 RepID=A0ABM5HHA3_DRORH|nr:nuclear pore complex protein DDB_G0274915 [Drosophila rhopaloa]